MGFIQHHAAVVVVYDHFQEPARGAIARVREYAEELSCEALPVEEDWGTRIVGPVDTLVNGGQVYVCLPDGSKRGWATAERGDKLRERFLTELHPFAETWFDASDGDAGPIIDQPS